MARTNGQTALIIGSPDRVGRMVAEKLGHDGWRVLVHGRDRGCGEQVVASINTSGGTAEFLLADISTLAEVRRLADAVQRTTRRLISSSIMLALAPVASGDAADQRRRPRIALRGELSGWLPADRSTFVRS
jgi:NAD(P)-dependent dehydrogenase (short-subunit alcohol dehydrogenase family)